MRQVRNPGLLALTSCAIAAAAACSAPPAAPAAAPSADSGVGSAASQAAGPAPSPSTSPTTRPAPPPATPAEKSPPAGQGGQSSDVDWKRVAFRALGCKHHADLPKRAEVQHLGHADLTGDGRRDAIVAASCPTTTSTHAVHVFVFGADSSTEPLLTIGKDAYLRTVDVRTRGRVLTVDSEALSDDAPLCCSDLRITQSWKWTGSAFTRTAFRSTKL